MKFELNDMTQCFLAVPRKAATNRRISSVRPRCKQNLPGGNVTV